MRIIFFSAWKIKKKSKKSGRLIDNKFKNVHKALSLESHFHEINETEKPIFILSMSH